MKKIIFLPLLLISFQVFSQTDSIFSRLSALHNNDKIWYNIDGYSVTSEVFERGFNEKELKKLFRKHSLTDKDVKTKNENIRYNNYYVNKQESIGDALTQNNSYYFLENQKKTITVISFMKTGNTDKNMEEELVNYIIEDKVPKENYVSMDVENINFNGRIIPLGGDCHWTFLNTLLCPYNGEMNWSIHKSRESAEQAIENQLLLLTKTKKVGKVTSEETINVEFEGVPTKAKKVTFTIKGLTSLVVGMSGAKALTIYYVAEKVRGNYLSCVMSHWNNDNLNESGLPPLLEEVITLK